MALDRSLSALPHARYVPSQGVVSAQVGGMSRPGETLLQHIHVQTLFSFAVDKKKNVACASATLTHCQAQACPLLDAAATQRRVLLKTVFFVILIEQICHSATIC